MSCLVTRSGAAPIYIQAIWLCAAVKLGMVFRGFSLGQGIEIRQFNFVSNRVWGTKKVASD